MQLLDISGTGYPYVYKHLIYKSLPFNLPELVAEKLYCVVFKYPYTIFNVPRNSASSTFLPQRNNEYWYYLFASPEWRHQPIVLENEKTIYPLGYVSDASLICNGTGPVISPL